MVAPTGGPSLGPNDRSTTDGNTGGADANGGLVIVLVAAVVTLILCCIASSAACYRRGVHHGSKTHSRATVANPTFTTSTDVVDPPLYNLFLDPTVPATRQSHNNRPAQERGTNDVEYEEPVAVSEDDPRLALHGVIGLDSENYVSSMPPSEDSVYANPKLAFHNVTSVATSNA
jgi:hypothetical protein